jgi:metal-sulfur cluster biosynthetic enzyme
MSDPEQLRAAILQQLAQIIDLETGVDIALLQELADS